MPAERLGPPRDQNFPEYAYAKNRMVYAYKEARKGSGITAKLFLGEWVKIKDLQAQEWIPVTFRGGEGYVRERELTRERHLEIFFIDVDQGDSILIQTPEKRKNGSNFLFQQQKGTLIMKSDFPLMDIFGMMKRIYMKVKKKFINLLSIRGMTKSKFTNILTTKTKTTTADTQEKNTTRI